MSEPTRATPAAPHKPAIGRRIGTFIVRLYAVVILFVVLWTGYTAISYLAHYVFTPVQVPNQFLDPLAHGLPATQPSEGTHPPSISGGQKGSGASQALEPSISHYHRDPAAFDFVGRDGCTTSGCHTLLPHTKRKEVRAFANFHSTFLDCSACHEPQIKPPTVAVWLSNKTGQPQDPPALLRLMTSLETTGDAIRTRSAEVSPTVIGLLRQSEADVGLDPPLHDALILLDTSEPGSPVWQQAIGDLKAILPNRIRGEYAARITPKFVADSWTDRQTKLAGLAKEFNATHDEAQRERINKQVHEGILAKPEACLTCHGGEPPRFDLQQLGYSPQRIAALSSSPVARMIQQIREGRPFHLPGVLEERRETR